MSSDDVTVEMGRLALHGLVVGAARYYMGRSTVSAVRMAHDLARLAPQLGAGIRGSLAGEVRAWVRGHPLAAATDGCGQPWRELLGALEGMERR